jgi:hypothetical protein
VGPSLIIAHTRRIILPPSSRTAELVSPRTAQTRFDSFAELLSRCPNLTALEIAHNPFCPHDGYGLGDERRFTIAQSRPLHPPSLGLTTLSVALKCRICSVELARTIASWCKLTSLRASVVTYLPPVRILPPLLMHLAALHLKVGDDWSANALLDALAPCRSLKELHVAPYDASRKVSVADSISGLPRGGPLFYMSYGNRQEENARSTEAFLAALGRFELEELDMCFSPVAFDPSMETMQVGPQWREKAAAAAERLVEACPTLKRGWWWLQLQDLDYGQLQGYARFAWTVEDGRVNVASQPRSLAPLVVRNQDGQGTTTEMPSEEWN